MDVRPFVRCQSQKVWSKYPFLSSPLPFSSWEAKNFFNSWKVQCNIWWQWLLYCYTNFATLLSGWRLTYSWIFTSLIVIFMSLCRPRDQSWITQRRRKRINNCDARRRQINHSVNAPVPLPGAVWFLYRLQPAPLIRQFSSGRLELETDWRWREKWVEEHFCLLPRPL